MPRRLLALVLMAAIAGALVLTGCGRKGDLYLPDTKAEAEEDGEEKSEKR